jgi:hypothetical protein
MWPLKAIDAAPKNVAPMADTSIMASIRNGIPTASLRSRAITKWAKKDGVWTEYDPTGHKVSSKYFDEGVEAPEKMPR